MSTPLAVSRSLKMNTVSFYTISKVAVAPAVLLLEFLLLGARATPRVIASVAVVCFGIAISTVTDTQVLCQDPQLHKALAGGRGKTSRLLASPQNVLLT